MKNKCIKYIVLMIFAVGFGIACGKAMAENTDAGMPIKVVNVTIRKEFLNQFVSQTKKFAEDNAFAIRVAHSSPNPNDILLQLWREDVKLIGVNIANTDSTNLAFEIGFYRNGDKLISGDSITQLVVDFKKTVGQVQSATFPDEIKH